MDRNQDGRIDGDEMDRVPGPFKDAMSRMRIDTRRGISQGDFIRIFPQMMESMQGIREAGSGGGDSGRGGFGGGDSGRGGDWGRGDDSGRGGDQGRGEENRGGDYGRGSDDRGGRSSSKTPSKTEKGRTTVDLPANYLGIDTNKDRQISLFEWERSRFNEFYQLDVNNDGILTPRELGGATAVASSSPTTSQGSDTAAPTNFSVVVGPSQPSERSGGTLKPVAYDESSSEGRWATYVFSSLDRDKDGKLTEDEWNKSERTRKSFEKYNVVPKFPTDKKEFGGWVVAVMQEDRNKGRDDGNSKGGGKGDERGGGPRGGFGRDGR